MRLEISFHSIKIKMLMLWLLYLESPGADVLFNFWTWLVFIEDDLSRWGICGGDQSIFTVFAHMDYEEDGKICKL